VRITVEFLGLARRLTGERQTEFQIHNSAALRDIVVLLAERFPSLLSQIIVPQTYDLISPYYFNVGGRFAATDLETSVDGNQPLILMCLEAGG